MITSISSSKKGFTLLELLISLTILSVIIVIIFGAFRIGVRAWEKGEKDVETHQRQRIVLNLMKRQLASACLRDIKISNKNIFSFKGDNKSLEFLSYMPLVPGNKLGMVYVRYRVISSEDENQERLQFFEKNLVLLDKEFNPTDLTEEDFYALIPLLYSVTFEYLKGTTEEKEFDWQESWDPEKDKGFPFAVRIILKKEEDTPPLCVIVRIWQNEIL